MKVKFLKDHLRHKSGDVANVIAERGNYYIRCNVAVEVTEDSLPLAAPKKTAAPKKKKGA